jgi:hypothetical protein
MYISVQDRNYKVKDYKEAVTVLATFSFTRFKKTNKQYRDSVCRRYEEVLGYCPINNNSDKDFIMSLDKIGEIKISQKKPSDVKKDLKSQVAKNKKMSGIKLKG